MKTISLKITLLLLLGAMVPVSAMEQKKALSTFEQKELDDSLLMVIENDDLKEEERLKKVAECLNKGADIETIPDHCNGRTPLMQTILFGYNNIGEFLILLGADVNAIDHYLRTPLLMAIQKKNNQLITSLIHAGADLYTTDFRGKTSFSFADQGSDIETYLHEVDATYKNFKKDPAKLLMDNQSDLKMDNLKKLKIAYAKMLFKNMRLRNMRYGNTDYFIVLTTLFKVCNYKNMKKIVKECKLFDCSLKEKQEFLKLGFPLTEELLDTEHNLLKHKNNGFKTDIFFVSR